MKRTITYSIKEPMTILDFLKLKYYSQALIVRLKNDIGGVLLNNQPVFVKTMMVCGDVLNITISETGSNDDILPVELPLDIIYEDDDLMIVNKSANMPIHPSIGNHHNTLANAVAWKYKQEGIPFVYRCINRLDRDTTGLLILAKHAYSGALLSRMVSLREIHREYLAIVTGVPDDVGTIVAPIARVADSVIERQVSDHGEYACTHFKRLKHNTLYSLVSLKLETGRTHQIRVHMKHIGHPLPGDFLYNPEYSIINRQALHSHKLKFTHPITNVDLEFTCPLPQDMYSIIPGLNESYTQ